ncbi:integrin alpha-X-like isoform X1 [Tachysurus ichikawai]
MDNLNTKGTHVGNSSSIQIELAQGGFSIALSEDVSVFGAVGTFSWSGGLEEKISELSTSFINASSVDDMDNSYLGYSVAVAKVLGNCVYFAAHRIQLGSYYGAELCVVYGGNNVLLAVGAPMFYTAGVGGKVHICSVEAEICRVMSALGDDEQDAVLAVLPGLPEEKLLSLSPEQVGESKPDLQLIKE